MKIISFMRQRYGLFGAMLFVGMACSALCDAPYLDVWVTPIGWYGYILCVDSLVKRRTGQSLLCDNRAEFFIMLPYSIALWTIFELHNLLFMNWEYVGNPITYTQTFIGSFLAFATILPALYETGVLLKSFPLFSLRVQPHTFSRLRLITEMVIGSIFILVTIIFPSYYTGPLIWAGYFFLILPLNYYIGAPSILREREDGQISEMVSLFCAGLVCGFVWEFLNYWAASKWIYHVPYCEDVKIFEMPVLGFLGFGPFAITFIEMYRLARFVGRRRAK